MDYVITVKVEARDTFPEDVIEDLKEEIHEVFDMELKQFEVVGITIEED